MASVSVQSFAVNPTNTDVIYAGTYSGGLFHNEGSGLGIYKSTNGGGAWAPINNGLTTPNVAALAIDPFNPETVYAGTDRGLFITTGAGNEWTLLDGAPKDLINAIVSDPSTPGRFYITTQVSGMFLTTDGGANWVSLNSGLPFPPLPLGDLVLDPAHGVLYVAVRGAGVFKGTVTPVRNIYLPVLLSGQ